MSQQSIVISPAPGGVATPLAIIVMGVSGSGKSTLGALLAKRLGCAFLEGDAFHSRAAIAKMHVGHPLTDADRWPWLDRIGAALAAEVAAHGIAVAACSALRRVYRDRLAGCVPAPTRFVLPDGDAAMLLARMRHRSGHFMPPELLTSQLATLERPGTDEAALILDSDAPPEQLVTTTLAWLSDASRATPLTGTGSRSG